MPTLDPDCCGMQIFEYVQLDLKKYMGQDRHKSHLPVKKADLKVCALFQG
jgi:hypothetical protein